MFYFFIKINIYVFSKVGEAVRVVFGRKSVEPRLPDALRDQNTILSQLFHVSKYELSQNMDDESSSEDSTVDRFGVFYISLSIIRSGEFNFRYSVLSLQTCLLLSWLTEVFPQKLLMSMLALMGARAGSNLA